MSKATVSNITKTLEKKNLCQRSTDNRDRRMTYLSITEKGREVMQELYPRFHQGEVEIVSSLGEEEKSKSLNCCGKSLKGTTFK